MSDPGARYERHLFVCTNLRPEGHPRGCCAAKGSEAIRQRLKDLIDEHGLRGRVRANAAGCLDQCEVGVTMVVYPDAVWYRNVTLEAAEEIFRSHVLGGAPVARHRMGPADFEEVGRIRAARKPAPKS